MQIYCIGKAPAFDAHLIVDDNQTGSMAVAAGDKLTVSGTASSTAESWTATDETSNGKPFSAIVPSGFSDVDSANNVEIQTSALSTSGNRFTLTYVTNS